MASRQATVGPETLRLQGIPIFWPYEFARDDDGDGFCEVHVNTMEGFVRSVG
jgi:hypothetical protein